MDRFRRKADKPNYFKIFAITVAVIAIASAVALVIYKLFNKYFSLGTDECEDFLDDGCDDCDVCFEDDAGKETELASAK